MSRRRIPVVILSGFLGSGKTTLLNHLLRHSGGARIGVVVNDFGSINIDAMLVAGQVDATVSIGNGCLCCVADTEDLDRLFAKLAHKRSNIDVIVVEASGLSEPRSLIRLVRASANEFIMYGGLVVMIDAAQFGATRSRHPEVDQHIRLADLLVLNKTDRITDSALDTVTSEVRGTAAQTPIVITSQGRVAAELLFDSPAVRGRDDVARQMTLDEMLLTSDEEEHSHIHDHYRTASFTTDQALDPRGLLDFLENPPGDIYRIKGCVYFGIPGYRQKFIVHTVGRHIDVTARQWTAEESRVTNLVFIGTDVVQSEIDSRLSALVVPLHDATDSSAMLGIHRYWEPTRSVP